jgi:hypothetical protein
MAKAGKTEVILILDRSGSMQTIWGDVTGAFKTFLQQQRELSGECLFTLAAFDNQFEIVYRREDIAKADDALLEKTIFPRAGTALYDAIGLTFNEAGNYFDNQPEEEKPENVVVAIITDGEENSSKEYTQRQALQLIKRRQEKNNWKILFLASNQDAFVEGSKIGVRAEHTAVFKPGGRGSRSAILSMSQVVSGTRIRKQIKDLQTILEEIDADEDDEDVQ